MNTKIVNTHVAMISVGDCVEHEGLVKTVGRNDIKASKFMGATLYGDSYRLGTLPVKKVIILRAMP